ncbi:protein phosphatase 2C domain-containing protein [Actinomadura sp. DC4]|uniref:PP2C family serine/threonine-protein phosphatase n=1 Tax=Actinomadura sp. DC4 TaxID=3055069 RepID=UPI0025AFE90B|nr:protein phosphatase 2C domain-containing protein [Actinomadura sp. DC4]MDN3351373.1 protein phosphatase 2C domain-containing protein [Actinomadura sp. DC4]
MAAVTEEQTCPACDTPVYPGEDYCEACGHRLDAPVRRCPGCGASAISGDGYCDQCGLRQPDGTDHVEAEAAGSAGVSDRGLRHSRNEDAMALTGTAGGVAAVVCDGVSSSSRPEEASRIAADTGAAALAELHGSGTDAETATRTAAERAAEAVAGLVAPPSGETTQPAGEPPSCTYVSALAHGGSVTVGWIGDSRAYWLPAGGGGERLTDDDSWAGEMVSSGAMTEEEAERHPNAHVITAWLGADAGELDTHVRTITPDEAGVVLVCSDGLWNYLPEPAELAAAAPDAASAPLAAARALTQLALEAGGRDNITVVVIPFTPSAHPNQEQAE